MVRQLVAKLRQKRKGIILINAVLASIIVGLVGIALASIYSGMFSTMSAGKAGSQGEQMAAVETSVIKMKGYDESDSVTHGWKDMSDLVGEDGKQWESKVTLERTKTTDDGNTVKVMKVAVRKTGDLISRYSAEVPLVEGLDVYSKDEIDQMFTTLNSQISQLSSDLDAFKKETADNFTNIINNINQINANLDDLQKMINAETQARVDADKAISNNLSNETKARQAADAALSNQIDSLKSSLTDLQSALNTEISNRQAADKTLQNNINSEANARQAADAAEAKARQDAINNLQAQINSKYEELYNLYKGLKSRLDGNEFVKSKDSANNIALKYEQKDGESTKSLHGYVDGVEVPLASQNKGTDYQLKYQYYVHHYLTSGGKTHADHYDIGRTTYFNSDKHGKVILDNSVINGDFTSTSGYPGYIKILGYEIVPIYNGGLEINGVIKVKSSWDDYTITSAVYSF